ncbi:MAG: hypothetical protein NC078_09250 [Ruminococcus sp.]|nr:hypothetical protein [Ruminococcus sp.]
MVAERGGRVMRKPVKIRQIALCVFIALVLCFFTADSVTVKVYKKPPLFCIKAVEYSDGISAGYYGAGYKILRDYNVSDGTENYYITLWLLPYELSL